VEVLAAEGAPLRRGVLTFSHMMVGGAQRIIEHPYIDPTGSKPSEMLMVWAHAAAKRVAQVVDGVYTLEVEQLHDLQDWCAPLCGPPSGAHARSHRAHNAHNAQLSQDGSCARPV
jgi:hypothetical protein